MKTVYEGLGFSNRCWGGIMAVLLVVAGAGLWGLGATGCDEEKKCTDGEWRCSEDALELKSCVGGRWETVRCMEDQGELCQAGACVTPTEYGDPEWDPCEGEAAATEETLYEKMVYFEDRAANLHIHPDLKWFSGVELPCKEVACTGGEEPPCYDCTQSAVAEEEATWEDVAYWRTGENDGLWSALYLTAQAYRYGATESTEALENVKILMRGQQDRMKVTSVPGIFTRQYIPPNVPGIACPEDLERYVPDEDKVNNKWVKVGDDGCLQYVDADTMEWVSSDRCGLDDYAGWCFLDNVSQDEYSGHMLALAAVARLVDDPEVQDMVYGLLLQVGQHLTENGMELVDWDGRRTEHGWLWPPVVFGGFMAVMDMAYMKVCAEVTGEEEFHFWYDECMLQKSGQRPEECFQDNFAVAEEPFDTLLSEMLLYVGRDSCGSNWNNFSMHMLHMHTLIWYERDPLYRALYQESLRDDVFDPPGDRARKLIHQHNALFNFMYAAHKPLGPDSDGPAHDVVRDGICMLRQFPASTHENTMECPPVACGEPVCDGRRGDPLTDYCRTAAERCMGTFIWWRNPYTYKSCEENPRKIHPPADYLLPYWMGRYYGFIHEEM